MNYSEFYFLNYIHDHEKVLINDSINNIERKYIELKTENDDLKAENDKLMKECGISPAQLTGGNSYGVYSLPGMQVSNIKGRQVLKPAVTAYPHQSNLVRPVIRPSIITTSNIPHVPLLPTGVAVANPLIPVQSAVPVIAQRQYRIAPSMTPVQPVTFVPTLGYHGKISMYQLPESQKKLILEAFDRIEKKFEEAKKLNEELKKNNEQIKKLCGKN